MVHHKLLDRIFTSRKTRNHVENTLKNIGTDLCERFFMWKNQTAVFVLKIVIL